MTIRPHALASCGLPEWQVEQIMEANLAEYFERKHRARVRRGELLTADQRKRSIASLKSWAERKRRKDHAA